MSCSVGDPTAQNNLTEIVSPCNGQLHLASAWIQNEHSYRDDHESQETLEKLYSMSSCKKGLIIIRRSRRSNSQPTTSISVVAADIARPVTPIFPSRVIVVIKPYPLVSILSTPFSPLVEESRSQSVFPVPNISEDSFSLHSGLPTDILLLLAAEQTSTLAMKHPVLLPLEIRFRGLPAHLLRNCLALPVALSTPPDTPVALHSLGDTLLEALRTVVSPASQSFPPSPAVAASSTCAAAFLCYRGRDPSTGRLSVPSPSVPFVPTASAASRMWYMYGTAFLRSCGMLL